MRSASAAAHTREPSHFRSIVAHGFHLPGKRTRSLGCPLIRQTSSRRSRIDVSAQQTIHVGGEWREAASGATREILDPADATAFAVVAEGGARDTDAAVAAARAAFDEGPVAAHARRRAGRAAAPRRRPARSATGRRSALLESRDAGKTLEEGRVDVDCVADAFRYFADLVMNESGGRVVDAGSDDDPQRRRARARRRLRADHAVELPAAPGQLEDRPGPRRRQHLRRSSRARSPR